MSDCVAKDVNERRPTPMLNHIATTKPEWYAELMDDLQAMIGGWVCSIPDDEEIHNAVQNEIDFFLAIDGCNK